MLCETAAGRALPVATARRLCCEANPWRDGIPIAHHVTEWTRNHGPTDLANLAPVCGDQATAASRRGSGTWTHTRLPARRTTLA